MDRKEAIQVLQTALTAPFVYGAYANAINMAIEALSQPNYETDTEVRLAVTNRKKEKVILWDAYGEVEYYPIEALSAETSTETSTDQQKHQLSEETSTNEPTDLISRADAIEAVRNICNTPCNEYFVNALKALPSAETPTFQQKHQLSEETPTDLISREDAMGAVQDHFNADGFKGYDDGQKMMDRIKALPSADRPTELLDDGTLKVNVQNGAEVNRVLVWGDDGRGGLYYADDRPSGEWIKHKGEWTDFDFYPTKYECSQCHYYVDEGYDSIYCPNCGANMGGNK